MKFLLQKVRRAARKWIEKKSLAEQRANMPCMYKHPFLPSKCYPLHICIYQAICGVWGRALPHTRIHLEQHMTGSAWRGSFGSNWVENDTPWNYIYAGSANTYSYEPGRVLLATRLCLIHFKLCCRASQWVYESELSLNRGFSQSNVTLATFAAIAESGKQNSECRNVWQIFIQLPPPGCSFATLDYLIKLLECSKVKYLACPCP